MAFLSRAESSFQEPKINPTVNHDEKTKDPIHTIRPLPIDDEAGYSQAQWNPGYVSRFPWLGFGALFIILLCSGASVLTLLLSRGVSENDWVSDKLPPNVILNGLNNVANICFTMAIANGIAIAWWRRALKSSTIGELQRSWEFANSPKAVVMGAKYFNCIALAALVTKMTIIDGMLMQKATGTQVLPDGPIDQNISVFANETFPITGWTSGRSGRSGLVKSYVRDDLRLWALNPLFLPTNSVSGCINGTCELNVTAAGFQFDCDEPTVQHVDYGRLLLPEAGADTAKPAEPLYEVSFQANQSIQSLEPEYAMLNQQANITMTIVFMNATDSMNATNEQVDSCPGTLRSQTCTLRPAIISYPVIVSNYSGQHSSSTLSLKPTAFNQASRQQLGYSILSLANVYEEPGMFGGPIQNRLTNLAGAFQMYLGGSADLRWDGIWNFQLDQTGASSQYMVSSPPQSIYCGFQYVDPMHPVGLPNLQSMAAAINQMTFALATDISRSDPANFANGDISTFRPGEKSYTAQLTQESIHYTVHIPYMIGAIVSTIFCVLCVLPVYWGYWELGRPVSLGPMEIAHAFRSPMTMQAGPVPSQHLMQAVGNQPVQFGHIISGDGQGVMGFADPENVEKLQGAKVPGMGRN